MGVPYVERNISKNPEAKNEYLEKGYDLLPALEIGNTVIVDYGGTAQLLEILAREGYL